MYPYKSQQLARIKGPNHPSMLAILVTRPLISMHSSQPMGLLGSVVAVAKAAAVPDIHNCLIRNGQSAGDPMVVARAEAEGVRIPGERNFATAWLPVHEDFRRC